MDASGHDSQLLKGVLTLVILRLVAEQESYGYELVERVHRLGLTEVPEGSIYPALSRLERDGHVVSYLVPSNAGPARKYYRLTDSGEAFLRERGRAWQALVAALAPMFPASARSEVQVAPAEVQSAETRTTGDVPSDMPGRKRLRVRPAGG
jgi:PadR family transcriptional regulator PadR